MHCFIALSLTVASPYLRAFFGEGHGLIIAMSELRCTGNELRITDCERKSNKTVHDMYTCILCGERLLTTEVYLQYHIAGTSGKHYI